MKTITLSFDNGPDPDVTPHVLDVLAKHDIFTTFFVVGDKLRDPARLDLVKRAHDEGHWIGNHTFNHLVPLGQSKHDGLSDIEITLTQELIGPFAHERRFFRPFGGGGEINQDLLDRRAEKILTTGGYSCVLWNVIPRDWEQPDDWPEECFSQCRQVEHPLVVLHDITTGAMKNLDVFLSRARNQGLNFTQDFPVDCVPIECGKPMMDLGPYVRS